MYLMQWDEVTRARRSVLVLFIFLSGFSLTGLERLSKSPSDISVDVLSFSP